MRRPLVVTTMAFLLGIVVYELGPWPMVIVVLLLGSAALFGPVRHRQTLVLVLVVGLLASLYTHVRWLERQHPLPVAIDDETLTIEGTVLGPPEHRAGGGQRLLLRASQLTHADTTWSWKGTVQVTISEPLYSQEPLANTVVSIRGGEMLRVTGNWRLFGQPRNPGEPDWSRAMARRGINGSLWTEQDSVAVLGQGQGVSWWLRFAWELRQGVVVVYQQHLPAPYDAVLAGLTLGVDDRIPAEMVEDFESSGVLHLLAVSGGNVAFVVAILLFVLRRVPIPLWLENLLLLAAIFIFTLVTGAEASVVRASLMASLLILARWLLRRPELVSVIALTTLIMLIADPYAFYAAGFQLSFAAVIGLALWTRPLEERLSRLPTFIRQTMAATLAAQLGVLPLSIYYFNQVSLIAPVANLAILALVVPINLLALLLVVSSWAFAPLAWVMSLWTGWLLRLMTGVAALAARIPLATLNIPSIGLIGTLLLYLWLGWLTSKPWWLSIRQRVMASLILVAGLMILWWHPWPYRWEVTVLDVGQGDAIFVRMPNGRTALIDGGGRRSPLPDTVGKGVVLPFLRRQGIQQLDLMVVSHPHEDHYRGLMAVADKVRVKTVVTGNSESNDENYRQWVLSLTGKMRMASVTAGDQIILDPQVSIEVLAPNRATMSQMSVNNQSVVLRLRHGQTSLYLMGDLEEDGELSLGEVASGLDEHVVLKVGHHGSSTSTSDYLLSGVRPDLAAISVGQNNSFGHPAAETMARLQSAGSRILRTDQQGALIFVSDGRSWRVDTMR